MSTAMENAVAAMSLEATKEAHAELRSKGLETDQLRSLLERTLHHYVITRLGSLPSPTSAAVTKRPNDQQHVDSGSCMGTAEVERFLLYVISLAREELCDKKLTVTLLQDVFDVSVARRCEALFTIVENHIAVWKEPFFFEGCKNLILRMCNDLLKRLSRTVDTNFCGRIYILLAKSLPLNEKSGLNLPGQFNTANITTFEREADGVKNEEGATKASAVEGENEKMEVDGEVKTEEVDMEVGEIREHSTEPSTAASATESPTIPYSQLYGRFWEIQSHFSNPPSLLQNPNNLKRFESNVSEVLRIFTSYKLEKPSRTEAPVESGGSKERKRAAKEMDSVPSEDPALAMGKRPFQNGFSINSLAACTTEAMKMEVDGVRPAGSADQEIEDTFFAKYLTNQKLFALQLADSQFRRYFLCQCLIIVNYVLQQQLSKAAAITPNPAPATSQQPQQQPQQDGTALKEIFEKCLSLLKETYPHGSHFAESARRILTREKMWSSWKGEGCPDLVTLAAQLEIMLFKKRPQLRHDPHTINLGNKELTRLWNINPDNLSACRDKSRESAPDLIKFLKEGLDQMDPEQGVEEQYKLVNDERYQWMASRFLLQNSEQYMSTVLGDAKTPRLSTAKHLEKAILNTALATPELKERAQAIQAALTCIEKEKAEKAAAEAALQEEEEQRLREEVAEKRRTTKKVVEPPPSTEAEAPTEASQQPMGWEANQPQRDGGASKGPPPKETGEKSAKEKKFPQPPPSDAAQSNQQPTNTRGGERAKEQPPQQQMSKAAGEKVATPQTTKEAAAKSQRTERGNDKEKRPSSKRKETGESGDAGRKELSTGPTTTATGADSKKDDKAERGKKEKGRDEGPNRRGDAAGSAGRGERELAPAKRTRDQQLQQQAPASGQSAKDEKKLPSSDSGGGGGGREEASIRDRSLKRKADGVDSSVEKEKKKSHTTSSHPTSTSPGHEHPPGSSSSSSSRHRGGKDNNNKDGSSDGGRGNSKEREKERERDKMGPKTPRASSAEQRSSQHQHDNFTSPRHSSSHNSREQLQTR